MCMALTETIKVSEPVKDRLETYRDTKEHTSFDSALRELVPEETDD